MEVVIHDFNCKFQLEKSLFGSKEMFLLAKCQSSDSTAIIFKYYSFVGLALATLWANTPERCAQWKGKLSTQAVKESLFICCWWASQGKKAF